MDHLDSAALLTLTYAARHVWLEQLRLARGRLDAEREVVCRYWLDWLDGVSELVLDATAPVH